MIGGKHVGELRAATAFDCGFTKALLPNRIERRLRFVQKQNKYSNGDDLTGVLSATAGAITPLAPAPARRFALGFGVVVALFATSPLWLKGVGLYQYLALEVLIWSLYALGYNLLLGYGGLPSFGHGAFFGVGAYAAGLALKQADVGLLAGIAAAVAAAALLGAVVALFISHRRGIYYALMTIAFGQLAWFVSIKCHSAHAMMANSVSAK